MSLFKAIQNNNEELAIDIVKNGNVNLGLINERGATSLIAACFKKMNQLALELIATGRSKPEHHANDGYTALMIACENNMAEVALALIATGHSNPGHIVASGTALIAACSNEMSEVALALIATGESNLGHVNQDGDTALINACYTEMANVALALIATGQSKPEQVGQEGNTALIWACVNNMTEVALALIATGQTNPEQITNNNHKTALDFAKQNNMTDVIKALTYLTLSADFNVNSTCFDLIEGADVLISEATANGSIVFVIYDTDISSAMRVAVPDTQVQNINVNHDIIYECHRANLMLRPENIIREKKFFDLKKLTGFGDLCLMSDIEIVKTQYLTKIFVFKKTNRVLNLTVSDDYLSGRIDALGARHCQAGQSGTVYKLVEHVNYVCSDIKSGVGGKRKTRRTRYKKRKCKSRRRK